MKIRNFKKAICRAGHYKYHEPKIHEKIWIYDYGNVNIIYYDCHKLHTTLYLNTGKFEYQIKRKKK